MKTRLRTLDCLLGWHDRHLSRVFDNRWLELERLLHLRSKLHVSAHGDVPGTAWSNLRYGYPADPKTLKTGDSRKLVLSFWRLSVDQIF
jgi:hypothetical protein